MYVVYILISVCCIYQLVIWIAFRGLTSYPTIHNENHVKSIPAAMLLLQPCYILYTNASHIGYYMSQSSVSNVEYQRLPHQSWVSCCTWGEEWGRIYWAPAPSRYLRRDQSRDMIGYIQSYICISVYTELKSKCNISAIWALSFKNCLTNCY